MGRIAGASRKGGRWCGCWGVGSGAAAGVLVDVLRGGGRDAWGYGGVLGGGVYGVAHAGPVEELADGLSGDAGAGAAGALGVAVEALSVTCCQVEELELCRCAVPK